MDIEEKSMLVEALIDEYLKPERKKEDVQKLMEKLQIKYSSDDLTNMSTVLKSVGFIEMDREKD